ncbi:MAG: Stp1/IreP family PP2C-type Ser/Thr phosphatase [Oscillospiraceae bacterium]|jgi:protein phosphatase|nr:Stp1/IreP family PP2C-type Ser/Thr phosphatase [Oscillospiraceae bacterium]
MEIWGVTDKGKVRAMNQDVFMTMRCEEREVAVLVVCDGMGGARSGDVASFVATERFMAVVREYIDMDYGLDEIAERLPDAALQANTAVYERSLRDPGCAGMGTTLVAAAVMENGEAIVNIGDSRAYHIADGSIRRVTRDHSVVEEMVERGDITREQARTHSSRNLITRSLGSPSGDAADVFLLALKQGEYILLCSDGLSNVVTDEEIQREVTSGSDVKAICDSLLELALLRGAPDNVTVVLLKK